MRKYPEPRRHCDVETPEDFARYYARSIIGIPQPNGEVIPYWSRGFDGNQFAVFMPATAKGETFTLSFRDVRDRVSFANPDFGMVNVGATCVYSHVTANRGAEKGYHSRRVNLIRFNEWDLKGDRYTSDSPEFIWSLFNKQYHTPTEAIQALEQGERVGCAVSPQVGLITRKDCPNLIVAFRRNICGYIDGPVAKVQASYAAGFKLLSRHLGREVRSL